MAERPNSREARDRLDPAAVCTLPPDALEARLAWIDREILPRVVATQRFVDGLRVELHDRPGLGASVDRLIELERTCCAGIDYSRRAAEASDRIVLEIRGVDPEAAFFGRFARDGAHEEAASAPGGRLARSAGIGVAMGVMVCCVLPMAAIAVVGPAAASLALLDTPVAIAGASVLGGVATWWAMGRRRRRRAASDPCGCGPQTGP